MCGSFGTDQTLRPKVAEAVGIDINEMPRARIRPTDVITSIIHTDQGLALHHGSWGIKPNWSKQLLINARFESINSKPTFRTQYQYYRCLIPFSFWFDNQKDSNTKKIIGRYQFTTIDHFPLFMAGIYYPDDDGKIVSVTTAPAEQIKPVKDRMPLIFTHNLGDWLLNGEISQNHQLMFDIDAI